jgi:uncharacterized protein
VRASTRRQFIVGPAGRIECAVDGPEGTPQGTALIAHPHPLFGGSLDNKVVQTLARAFVERGYEAWRPNMRGVGETEGTHDEGRGELEDLAAVVAHLGAKRTAARFALAGFSFGAALAGQLSTRIACEKLVLVGLGITRLPVPKVQADALVIHGELDETVPLAAVLDWARPQDLPVVLVPGADHFFNRKLPPLRRVVSDYLR